MKRLLPIISLPEDLCRIPRMYPKDITNRQNLLRGWLRDPKSRSSIRHMAPAVQDLARANVQAVKQELKALTAAKAKLKRLGYAFS